MYLNDPVEQACKQCFIIVFVPLCVRRRTAPGKRRPDSVNIRTLNNDCRESANEDGGKQTQSNTGRRADLPRIA